MSRDTPLPAAFLSAIKLYDPWQNAGSRTGQLFSYLVSWVRLDI